MPGNRALVSNLSASPGNMASPPWAIVKIRWPNTIRRDWEVDKFGKDENIHHAVKVNYDRSYGKTISILYYVHPQNTAQSSRHKT